MVHEVHELMVCMACGSTHGAVRRRNTNATQLIIHKQINALSMCYRICNPRVRGVRVALLGPEKGW
jgi:hypothetical protein